MSNIKFKERDVTNGIAVNYTMADEKASDYEKSCKRSGWFSIGYHFLIHPNGEVETGIPHNVYADPSIEGWKDNICVLIMGQTAGNMNALQKTALQGIAKTFAVPVKE